MSDGEQFEAWKQLDAALTKLDESITTTTRRMIEFGMHLNAAEIERADLGEFDNRARDWLARDAGGT